MKINLWQPITHVYSHAKIVAALLNILQAEHGQAWPKGKAPSSLLPRRVCFRGRYKTTDVLMKSQDHSNEV